MSTCICITMLQHITRHKRVCKQLKGIAGVEAIQLKHRCEALESEVEQLREENIALKAAPKKRVMLDLCKMYIAT